MTYTEDALIEKPTINLFSEMGWKTLDCYSETFGTDGLLGRENRSEVVLTRELRTSLIQINPDCTANEINLAIDELNRDRSAMSPIAANESCYKLLREGVKVKADDEQEDFVTVKIIDWQNADNNYLLSSLKFKVYTC